MNSVQPYERLLDHSPPKPLGIHSNISMAAIKFPLTPSRKTRQWRHCFSSTKQRMRTTSFANGILQRRGNQSEDELPLISANTQTLTDITSDTTVSSARQGITRSPFSVSPGTSSSLRRKVKTGAAGGLREAKTSIKGGTPSPKRKRSAAKDKLHALMHRVTDAVRVQSSPGLVRSIGIFFSFINLKCCSRLIDASRTSAGMELRFPSLTYLQATCKMDGNPIQTMFQADPLKPLLTSTPTLGFKFPLIRIQYIQRTKQKESLSPKEEQSQVVEDGTSW